MKIKKTAAIPAGAAAILLATLPQHEGIVYWVYKDPVGIATYCVGETENPTPGKRYTHKECMDQLSKRLPQFYYSVKMCIPKEMSDTRIAAFTSLAYNIGGYAFCKSSVVRLQNAGQYKEACDAMMKFRFAKGIPLPGLTRRRSEERALCMKDLT